MLIATGAITIAKIREAKSSKKAIKLPATVNPATGKELMQQTAFGELSWGSATQSYLKSIQKLTTIEMGHIMDEAKLFSRTSRREEEADDIDLDNECANLEAGSESGGIESDGYM